MMAYLKGLTPGQWFAIILAFLGVLGGTVTQLTDLFGPDVARKIVTVSNLLTTVLSAIMVPLTGTGAQIRAVNDLPGVDKIIVNKDANPALATIAIDPKSKVEPTPAAQAAVAATAAEAAL